MLWIPWTAAVVGLLAAGWFWFQAREAWVIAEIYRKGMNDMASQTKRACKGWDSTLDDMEAMERELAEAKK